jgi:co-chaperonin GroES (HSP10)
MLSLDKALKTTDGPMSREVLVVGDKVLIKPEEDAAKTPSGLFLPPGVQEKEAAMGGHVVNVGPGYPTVEPLTDGEPWTGGTRTGMRYVPLQAQPGDFAIFLRSNAVEVEIDGSKYLIVPHAAILLLIRDKLPLP